jgi:hypothetical protein
MAPYFDSPLKIVIIENSNTVFMSPDLLKKVYLKYIKGGNFEKFANGVGYFKYKRLTELCLILKLLRDEVFNNEAIGLMIIDSPNLFCYDENSQDKEYIDLYKIEVNKIKTTYKTNIVTLHINWKRDEYVSQLNRIIWKNKSLEGRANEIGYDNGLRFLYQMSDFIKDSSNLEIISPSSDSKIDSSPDKVIGVFKKISNDHFVNIGLFNNDGIYRKFDYQRYNFN